MHSNSFSCLSCLYALNMVHYADDISYKSDLVRAGAAWRAEMKRHITPLGTVEMPFAHKRLAEKHLRDCKMVAQRELILDDMQTNGRIAEVGVQHGNFSQEILARCAPAKLHLVDSALTLFGVAERFAGEIDEGQVELHEGDSSTELSRFPDDYFDVIYIDADHRYDGVKKDIDEAVRKISPTGTLIFNDYVFWSPTECAPYGVIHAVNELCVDQGWHATHFALGYYMYCDIAVRKLPQTPA